MYISCVTLKGRDTNWNLKENGLDELYSKYKSII